MTYLGKLLVALAILLASFGVPVHSHTCLASGKTDTTILSSDACCDKMDASSCCSSMKSACCLWECDYQYLDSENVIPPGFDEETLQPGPTMLTVILPHTVTIPNIEASQSEILESRPPPQIYNRGVQVHYSVFRI